MNKTRLLVATLTAGALAVGCGMLAACNNTTEKDKIYDVTFSANGGTYTAEETTVTVATDKTGRVAEEPTRPTLVDYYFVNYNTAEDGSGTTVTFGSDGYVFSENTTVYAQWAVIVLTLDANGGSLAEGATTVGTVDGSLEAIPEAPTAPTGKTFTGWYTAADGGEAVTLETLFTENATLYAQWRDSDGLYTVDGTLVAELEYAEPSDTAKRQYGAMDVMLNPGDVLILKIDGETVTHHAGTDELWTSTTHGVNFKQSEGTFTIKQRGGERPFTIWARYYTNGTPCWSVEFTDGLTDVLEEGKPYLVGQDFDNAVWAIDADNYIDPENGLVVYMTADAQFKIVRNDEGSPNYNVYGSSLYKMADGLKGYLVFPSGSSNGSVSAPGLYTITIETDDDGEITAFVFTPDESIEPVMPFHEGGFYVVGTNFGTYSEIWSVKTENYIDPENGIDVVCKAGAALQIVSCKDSYDGGENWNYQQSTMFDVCEGVEFKGTGVTINNAGTYHVTVDTTGASPVFTFTLVSLTEAE